MRALAAVLLSLATAVQSGGATTLRLSFRGPDGETIRPDRVTLLLDWYGGSEREAIPVSGDVATLNLDAARFGDTRNRPNEPSRILIEAKGYASLLSEPFGWPGQPAPAAIQFRDQAVAIREAETRDLRLTMRRPQPRSLRFVDQFDVPVAGASVSVYMFWTRQNHCFVFEGEPIVDTAKTDRLGRLAVPDGDFDYGVDVFGADDIVFDQEPVFYEKIVKPTGPETSIAVHRFNLRSVTIEVVARDQPLEGLNVVAFDRYTGCMDPGIRPLGTTDASGHAQLRRLSPDQFLDAAICRGKKELWRGPATTLRSSPARIVLDPSYKPADPTTDLCANKRTP